MTALALSEPPQWIFFVLEHLDLSHSVAVTSLNKAYNNELLVDNSSLFWELLCTRLARENKLWMTKQQSGESWKAHFMELWSMRWRFVPCPGDRTEPNNSSFRFSVNVCARFKPSNGDDAGDEVILPLHQMLPILREKSKLAKPSFDPWANAAVIEPVVEEDSGPTPPSAEASDGPACVTGSVSSDDSEEEEPSETSGSGQPTFKTGVLSVNEEHGTVLAVAPAVGLRQFQFNRVFSPGASQEDVYTSTGQPIVADFVNGLNGVVLVYGQTGSGKTFTMFGEGDRPWERGVVPRSCEEIIGALRVRREQGITCRLAVSYVEVYGNEVTDLLRGGSVVGQSRVAGQRYVLDGNAEVVVETLADINNLLAEGESQKRKAATAMNERSSRAHSIFVLSLTQQACVAGAPAVSSRLVLADLGGCEKVTKSKADEGTAAAGTGTWAEYYRSRRRLHEAVFINIGLFTLKKVISALNDRVVAEREGKPAPYVPYQDSKLTMLLSMALGGEARTCVVVTASMESAHATETLQALRFGEHCARVENKLTLQSADLVMRVKTLDDKIAEAEKFIKENERWENKVEIRKDIDGDERILKSVLVGAEDHRQQLEVLLKERRALLGV